jgi:triphosphatase
MGKEFELKYAATPEILAKVRESFGEFTEISMETTYYDTPAGDLSAQKMTLRRRLENGVSVCTLKMPDGLHSRKEYETEAATIEEAIETLSRLSGWPGLRTLAEQGLIPLCGARFTRLATTVTHQDCVVEIALDSGVLLGGGREVPLCELEIELKSGNETTAIRYANLFAGLFQLRIEPKSKFARAMALAE